MGNKDPTKSRGMNPGTWEGEVVPASYKPLAMVLIYSGSAWHHYSQTNTNRINKTRTY